jgi:hypothetical protein
MATKAGSMLLSSLGRAKNSRYQRYFVPYKISIVSFYIGTTMFFYDTNRKAVGLSFLMVSWLMLGSKNSPKIIHFPSRTLALLLAIGFGHPQREIHIVLSLAAQVL